MISKISKSFLSLLFLLMSRLVFCQITESGQAPVNEWAYQALNLPTLPLSEQKHFTIAVIDDGFNLEHNALKGFIQPNTGEIKDNYKDDDGNGFIDDYLGWDISDNDNDPSVTPSLASDYYHGTFVASVVGKILEKTYGPSYTEAFRLIPVKVLSDKADNTFIKDGYRGIEYALARNTDMIICAWSGGKMNKEEQKLLDKAAQQGVIIVGSAGNMYSRNIAPPASFPGVVSVAAVDSSLKKRVASNYHRNVDFCAPGQLVLGAHPLQNNAFFYEGETSAATALVAGCLAVCKQAFPEAGLDEIIHAVKNTAQPVDHYNPSYSGCLGAGLPDLSKAMQFLQEKSYRFTNHNPSLSKASVWFSRKYETNSWRIAPSGSYSGTDLYVQQIHNKDLNKQLRLEMPDTVWMVKYEQLISGLRIPVANFRISIPDKKYRPRQFLLSYDVIPLDSTVLYCSETVTVKDSSGTLTDGSEMQKYSNNTTCYWNIIAPEGYRVEIIPEAFETEPGVDFLWLFDGNKTLNENIIAKFSGSSLPPSVTSRSNQVLLWFVTDGKITGNGWKIRYRIVK